MKQLNTHAGKVNSHLPAYTDADIKARLLSVGASGTIYAFCFPEVREIFDELVNNRAGPNEDTGGSFPDIFEAAWTGRQDSVDRHFAEAWCDWSASVLTIAEDQKRFFYPLAGASEGIRECINMYSTQARIDGFEPRIHIFDGEYEGFPAYAAAAQIEIVRHDRDDWRSIPSSIKPDDVFFLSHPSAIDGSVWADYDAFARLLAEQCPTVRLFLDLTYVGSVAKDYAIHCDYPNIDTIFFSLSKPFGVYYHRIGGMFSRLEYPSLFGNRWFKNIQGLQFGTALLKRSSVHTLPRRYQRIRERATSAIAESLQLSLTPADVLLFATGTPTVTPGELERALLRGAQGKQITRVCVTPAMAALTPNAVIAEMVSDEISAPRAAFGDPIPNTSKEPRDAL